MRQAKARGMRLEPQPVCTGATGYPLDTVTCFVLSMIEGAELTGKRRRAPSRAYARRHPSSCTPADPRQPWCDVRRRHTGCIPCGLLSAYPCRIPPPRAIPSSAIFFASLDRCGPAAALRLASAASALAVSVKGAANSIPNAIRPKPSSLSRNRPTASSALLAQPLRCSGRLFFLQRGFPHAGPVKVNQSNKLKPGKTVTYKTRDYTLAWGRKVLQRCGGRIRRKRRHRAMRAGSPLEHTKSRVVYPDTYPDVDVEYLLTPSQVAVYRSNINGFYPFARLQRV